MAAGFKKICDEVILKKGKINIALSGGNTPKLLFEVLAENYRNEIDWRSVNFYWVDERCVRPDDSESNFGMTEKYLLNKIEIPVENVHRVSGENEPEEEAIRYSQVLKENLTIENNFPRFDLTLLGMGDDGHTASIFPDQMEILDSNEICAVAVHPVSGQKRITLTGRVINNSDRVYFLVTGKSKSDIIKIIFEEKNGYLNFPAAHIELTNGELNWYLDKEAFGQSG
ncbi:MAG: 6-phosphogluconolactonase [Ignavibacteria bacterium]|nr:6-phosphogluconolactonase [Ignavibacteria bacterium]